MRRFLRLVVVISIVANGAAAAVVQGELELRMFAVASSLERYERALTDDVTSYGTEIRSLRDGAREEAAP